MKVRSSPSRQVSFLAWQSHTADVYQNYNDHHRVYGRAVLPAAAYIVAILTAHQQLHRRSSCTIEDLGFHQVLACDATDDPRLEVIFDPLRCRYDIYCTSGDALSSLDSYASGTIAVDGDVPTPRLDLIAIRARCIASMDIDSAYSMLRHCNLHYGPYYQCIQGLTRRTGESLAKIEQHIDIENTDGFPLHPTTLDACFQSLIAAVDENMIRQNGHPYLPVRLKRIRYFANPGERFYCHTVLTKQNRRMIISDLRLVDSSGRTFVEAEGLCCLRAQRNIFV